MLIPDWAYSGDDPGLKLFTLANPKLPGFAGFRPFLYEIGCSDTNWIERVRALHPDWFVGGMDWRPQPHKRNVDCGDVLTAPLPMAAAFIGISSIEHVGLGHYDDDPKDEDGDRKTVQRLRDHLIPGGFIYLDVPYAPEGYWIYGTKCRCYDDAALEQRFGPHQVLGYTTPSVNGWIEKPTKNHDEYGRPFFYVALLIEKGNAEKS